MQKKKTVIVTGGSSGIGRAVSVKMSEEGYNVIFTYRDKKKADETREIIRRKGADAKAYKCDIANIDATKKLISEVKSICGTIDVLINCAGISNTKKIEEIDEEEWDLMVNTNLRGTFFIMKEAYLVMKAQRFGKMITITSIAGQRGGHFSGIHYSASKGALEAVIKSYALNGAEYGILSNGVSPGTVDTPMAASEGLTSEGIPLGRLAKPDEIADAVCFLASEKANYITGTTLDVNGGQMMR